MTVEDSFIGESFQFSELGDSNLATGKRNSESMVSDVRSVVTGDLESENTAVFAICESRGSLSEIGVAVYQTDRSICLLQQYSDSSTYPRTLNLFSIYPPLRIVICTNGSDMKRSKLYQTITDIFPLDCIVFMNRSDFNEERGMRYVQNLGTTKCKSSTIFACDKKYYAYSSVSALFSYLEQQVSVTFRENSVLFDLKPNDGPVFIDYHSAKSLELVANNSDAKSSCTLLGSVNRCQSLMGKRLLRMNLLQPLTDKEQINSRLEAIQSLISHDGLLMLLQKEFAHFPDIDNVICMLIRDCNPLDTKYGESIIHQALLIKRVLFKSKAIGEILQGHIDCPTLCEIYQKVSDKELDDMIAEINYYLSEDMCYSDKITLQQHQRFFAVKSESDSLLEVARRTLKETQSDIYEYVEAWSTQVDLQIDIKYQSKKGYYLSVSKKVLGSRSIETICSNYREGKSDVTFTTIDLLKLNSRVKESMNEILLASQQSLEKLFAFIRGKIDMLYVLSEAVAECDMICGLAEWTSNIGGTRPEFGDSLAVRNGRHPVLEFASNERTFVPNDYFSCNGNSFTVITGTNMSGKSTYAKQVMLLAILAQAGSFVPAEYASFPIYDRFMTRLGSDDDLESNASSFKMEMREAAFIVESITDRSLIVIDELGRGTGYTEGISIAMAICDELLQSNATVMFVTHFPKLVEYLRCHPRVSLVQLQTQISGIKNELRFVYRATKGIVSIANYGMKMAESVNLDSRLMNSARRALQLLEDADGQGPEHQGIRSTLEKRRIIIQTSDRLLRIQESTGVSEEVKEEQMRQIAEEFISTTEE